MRTFRTCWSHDPGAHSRRMEELGYLANALMAGCSIQSRPFTAPEAWDAAIAVCNLGLENWPTSLAPARRRRQTRSIGIS